MLPRHSWNDRARRFTASLVLSLAFPLFGQIEIQPEVFNTPDARPTMTNLPPPRPVPNTGRVTHNFTNEPDSYVIIQNQEPSEHLFIRFEDPVSRELVASIFVRANSAFSISNQMVLPSNEYVVKVASGTNWYGVDAAFGPHGIYSVMRPTLKLEPYTRHYLRLKSSPKGGLRQESVPWRQFGGTATNATAATNRSPVPK
jgi:hypothetical protein